MGWPLHLSARRSQFSCRLGNDAMGLLGEHFSGDRRSRPSGQIGCIGANLGGRKLERPRCPVLLLQPSQ
jgi:hypothetical protein